jgi:hypothetical protein
MMATLTFVGRVCLYAGLAAGATFFTAIICVLAVGLWHVAAQKFGEGWFLWAFPVEFALVFLLLVYNKPTLRQIFGDERSSS